MSELARVLAVLVEPSSPEHRPLWEALDVGPPGADDYTDLFLMQLFPYASVHLGPEGRLGGIARDRVAGFFHALGAPPVAEPDHLAFLLAAFAGLDVGGHEAEARARDALLVEHLLSWVPAFTHRVADLGGPAYRTWAGLLDELLKNEAGSSPTAAGLLPAHLADAPGLPDPRDGDSAEFLDGLLAPVRTGFVLTASDLARAAEDLGLGRRVGERRFVLRSLLDQDARAFLGWLRAAADHEAEWWASHWSAGSPTGDWWRDRAASTAALLGSLVA